MTAGSGEPPGAAPHGDGSVGSAMEGRVVEEIVLCQTQSDGPARYRHRIDGGQPVGDGRVPPGFVSGGFSDEISEVDGGPLGQCVGVTTGQSL
ncbi:hypothetical protein ACIBBE_25260 [Streptomyces sp. NPDC051644]|uniref:hypothetical protein n=1 Tax=Streptomyces sp. NPDC051644 TaxID=3365666 RepID=UPI0037A5D135